MKYIAVDVSGFLDRKDRVGDTNDPEFNLERLWEEGWVVFGACPTGLANATLAKAEATRNYVFRQRERVYGRKSCL